MKRLDRFQVERLAARVEKVPVYPDPRFPPSLYYRFLYLLAQEAQPEISVELGVCGGGGSLHLALGWPKGIVVGVDVSNDYPDQIKHIMDTCDNFEFVREDSLKLVDIMYSSSPFRYVLAPRVGILFIDTVHTYEQTCDEWDSWRPLMHPNGIVVLDDLFREGMQEAWDALPGRDKIRLDYLHIGGAPTDGGYGVILL
jgi:predicted O-methyltransferase YrrM